MNREDISDIAYAINWQVSLDKNKKVIGVQLYNVMDMSQVSKNEWPIFVDFKPSDLFIQRAKKQIEKLDWSNNKKGDMEASAHSYLFHSDPDNPVSSNDNTR